MNQAIISAESVSVISSLLILYGSLFESRHTSRKLSAFRVLVLVNLVGMLADLLSWVLDGKENMLALNAVLTTVSIAASFAVTAAFIRYVFLAISEKREIPEKPFRFLIIASLAAMVLTVLGCLTGSLFHFDGGVYTDGPLYGVYMAAGIGMMVLVLLMICRSVKTLGLHDSIAALSYVFIPLISMGINVFIPGFSMIYPAITISMLLIYIMMQSANQNILIQQEIATSQKAAHDELTGLLNRRALNDLMEQTEDADQNIGVLFGDINGLKYTNDHFGHEAGDRLICKFSSMLQDSFRRDGIFRISGDEFVALLPDVSEQVLTFRVENIRQKMKSDRAPCASVGAAYGKRSDLQKLLRLAEKNMYEEKQKFYERFPEYRR